MFESTVPVVHSYIPINISPNTQTTVGIRMHTWFTSNAHCLSSQSHDPYTHNTQTPIDNRMCIWFTSDAHGSSPLSPVYLSTYTHHVMHKLLYTSGCMLGSQVVITIRVRYHKCIFHMHRPHNTIGIRMHEWFASDAHRSISQSQVYIATYIQYSNNYIH